MAVNITLRLSGVLAFFAVLVMSGTWAMTTMSIEGVLVVDAALKGLAVLYGASILCVLLVYLTELDQ